MHHVHLFSTRLSLWNPLYAIFTCFPCFARAQLRIIKFASKVLCRHTTLIAMVNSYITFNFCITIIMLFSIRGEMKLRFCALADVNLAKDVRLYSSTCSYIAISLRNLFFLAARDIGSLHKVNQTQKEAPWFAAYFFNATSNSDVNFTVDVKLV